MLYGDRGHGGGALRSPVLTWGQAGQLEEDIVERRPTQAHLADPDPCATQLRGGFLDEDQAFPRCRHRQPVGPAILLRLAAADAKQRGPGRVTLLNVGQFDLEDVTADAILQLVAGPFGDHAAVIDDRDLVRELVRFFEVLRRQQDRRPFAPQVADDVPDLVAASRIEPGGRLVEEEHPRLGEHARREVEPPPHTARVCLCGSVGGIHELEAAEQLRSTVSCFLAREPEQAPEHLEVLAARQQLVDRCELTRQGQLLSHLRRVGGNVETEQLRLPRVRPKQGREDANEGGLAGAVRAEEAEYHSFRHLEVHAGQRRRRTEPLHQTFDANRGRRHEEIMRLRTPTRRDSSPRASGTGARMCVDHASQHGIGLAQELPRLPIGERRALAGSLSNAHTVPPVSLELDGQGNLGEALIESRPASQSEATQPTVRRLCASSWTPQVGDPPLEAESTA